MRVYLAGPDVFLPDAEEVGALKKAICQKFGFTGVFPLDTDLDPGDYDTSGEFGMAIYQGNTDLISECQILIANLTPFRGPSADVGTVFELGLARGLGLTVLGYSNDPRPFAERSREYVKRLKLKEPWAFEDFGLHDNLMIDGVLEASGGMVVPEKAPTDLARDLISFRKCLELVAGNNAGFGEVD